MAKKGQTVTRYSHNPLAKKFKCSECGKWFRTLQGLSGHMRFKHPRDYTKHDFMNQLMDVEEKILSLKIKGHQLELSESELKAMEQALREWARRIVYSYTLDVKLNSEDYKKYIISSFDQIYKRR